MKTSVRAMLIMITVVLVGAGPAQSDNRQWEVVSVPGICTFQIPPTVEIQKGTYKKANDQFRKAILQIVTSPNHVMAQPRGINGGFKAILPDNCRD